MVTAVFQLLGCALVDRLMEIGLDVKSFIEPDFVSIAHDGLI
jgi:hypothetical protein